jgi:hypothetical protein
MLIFVQIIKEMRTSSIGTKVNTKRLTSKDNFLLIDLSGIIHRSLAANDPSLRKKYNPITDKIGDFDDALKIIEDKLDEITTTLPNIGYRLYLEGRNNFRKELRSEYKAKRKESKKPAHLSEMFKHFYKNVDTFAFEGLEADDAISIDAAYLRSIGQPYIIVSIDRDLNMVPGWHYMPFNWRGKNNFGKARLFYISEAHAHAFFMKNLVITRSKDGLKGLPGYGEKCTECQNLLYEVPEGKTLEQVKHHNEKNIKSAYLNHYKVVSKAKQEYEEYCKLIALVTKMPEGYKPCM